MFIPFHPYDDGSNGNFSYDSSSEEQSDESVEHGGRQIGSPRRAFNAGRGERHGAFYGLKFPRDFGNNPRGYGGGYGGGGYEGGYGGGYGGYGGGGGGGITGGGGGGGGYGGRYGHRYGSGSAAGLGGRFRSGSYDSRRRQYRKEESSRVPSSCLGRQDCLNAPDGMTTEHPAVRLSRLEPAFDKHGRRIPFDQPQLQQTTTSSDAKYLTESEELFEDE